MEVISVMASVVSMVTYIAQVVIDAIEAASTMIGTQVLGGESIDPHLVHAPETVTAG